MLGIDNKGQRETRGLAILAKGNQIKRLTSTTYRVKSQNGNGNYLIVKNSNEWLCECADHKYRNIVCKHIHSVIFSLTLREKVSSQTFNLEPIFEEPESCKRCGSTEIIKRGIRKNKNGSLQRYLCKSCNHRFTVNYAFKKMRNNPKIITLVMDLYFKGISLRKIVDHVKQFYELKISHVAVSKWIKKYVDIMKDYLDEFTPQVSDTWHIDEMAVNIHGDYKWLWNLMDSDTRFLLASQVSNKREISDARKVFQEAKMRAKIRPMTVVTDGLRSYEDAVRKEFFTLRNPRTKHIRKPQFTDPTNNNVVERMQGTIRERDKIMRALKKNDSVFIDGQRIYYNFIRPHQALNGKTPAEVSGIDLGLKNNKWMELIRQSQRE